MTKVLLWIEKLERRFLNYARALVTVVIGLSLIIGAYILVSSGIKLVASPQITDAQPLGQVRFVDPGVRNIPIEPIVEIEDQSSQSLENDVEEPAGSSAMYPRYSDQIASIDANLMRFNNVLGLGYSSEAVLEYTENRIQNLEDAIRSEFDSLNSTEVADHLDDAVRGMVLFVDDLTRFYANEIKLDELEAGGELAITDQFDQHLREEIFLRPLAPYLERYLESVKERAIDTEISVSEAENLRAEGALGIATLGFVGIAILGGVLLLLVFRVELSLRQQADALLDSIRSSNAEE